MITRFARKIKITIHQSIDDGIYVFDLPFEKKITDSKSKMHIRELQLQDEPRLIKNFGKEKTKEYLDRLKSSYGFAAFFEEETIAGFTWLTFETREHEGEDPFFYKIQPKPSQSYLFDTFVLPQHRGQGVAKKVVESALAFASQAGKSTCMTIHDETNTAIIRVSKSIGFKKCGVMTYRRWGPWVSKNIEALSTL